MKYHVSFVKSSGVCDCREYRTKKEMNEVLDILNVRHDIVVLFWFRISDGVRVYLKGEPEEKAEEKTEEPEEKAEEIEIIAPDFSCIDDFEKKFCSVEFAEKISDVPFVRRNANTLKKIMLGRF